MRFRNGKKRSTLLSIFILTTTFLQSNASVVNLLKTRNSWEQSVPDDSLELNNCASSIVRRYGVESNNIVMLSGKRPYWIPSVFRNRSVYSFNTQIADIPASFKYESYVMTMLDAMNIQDDIRVLEYLKKFHPRPFCLIRLNNGRDLALNIYLEAIANYLTSIGRSAIIIATDYNHETDKSLRLYGYSNNTEANCGKVSLIDYGNCFNEETLDRIFSRIINMNQCPIRMKLISVRNNMEISEKNGKMEIRGYEWDLLQFILKNMNATSYVIPQSVTSGSTETRNAVINGEVDVGCGMLLQYNMEKVVYTKGYKIFETYILMPKKDPQPLWMNVFVPFKIEVWLVQFSTMIMVIFITRMVPSMRKKFSPWTITILPLGMGDPKTVKSTSFRMHFLVLALCGYILTQSYLASLSGILTKPRSSSEMQTLQELEESDYPLYGVQSIRLQLMETNPKLYKRFKELDTNEYFEMLDQVIAGHKKVAIHATMTMIQRSNASFTDINFHVIPEKIGFYSISMLLPETSVILASFDELISTAVEHSLVRHWQMEQLKEEREKNLNSTKLDKQLASNRETSNVKAITLRHLEGVFFLLAIGLITSSLTFIGELIVGSKNVPAHQRHLKALRLRRFH